MITYDQYLNDNSLLEIYYVPLNNKMSIVLDILEAFEGNNFKDFDKYIMQILIMRITNLDLTNYVGDLEFDEETSKFINTELSTFLNLIEYKLYDAVMSSEAVKNE